MLSNQDFGGRRSFLEKVTYKLKTDETVRVGQIKINLSFGMITV